MFIMTRHIDNAKTKRVTGSRTTDTLQITFLKMCYYETYILPASNKAEAYRHSILVSIFLN
jgi:hypothetical protein